MRNTVDHLAIVAGGVGSRLAAVAGDVPKVLVRVDGTPLLAHHLSLAASYGIDTVTVYAGHRAAQIRKFAEGAFAAGPGIRLYVEEQPLGTAGAILRTLDDLPEHFFVLYGDVLAAADLRRLAEYHLRRAADFTVLVQPTDHPEDSDLLGVDEDDCVTAVHACPHPTDRMPENIANAALYVVRRDALRPFAQLSGRRDFVKDVIRGLIVSGGRVVAYRSDEFVKDVGTPSRLAHVEAKWRQVTEAR